MLRILIALIALISLVPLIAAASTANVTLDPADTRSGYIARLLLNEAPFPGERGWVSESDSKAAMRSILSVLDSRLHHIPPGYSQKQVAAVKSDDIIDIITTGGPKGQCDGFHRDADGRFVAVPRVHERIDYLLGIASQGKPGRFARLINYAQELADAYTDQGMDAGVFADLHRVGDVEVTGRAYAWMTDLDCYAPGGNYVRIPDNQNGALGGNRFFTLRKLQ